MEKKELETLLTEMKTSLETSIAEKGKAEIAEQLTEQLKAVNEQIEAVKKLAEKDNAVEIKALSEKIDEMETDRKAMIRAFDLLQTRVKSTRSMSDAPIVKSLGELMGESLEEAGIVADKEGKTGSGGRIDEALKSAGGSFTLKLKARNQNLRKDMTVASTLTGDPVATYNQRQAIIPSQLLNLRDLIPTVESETGLYVTYSENTGEVNNIGVQTDGATKGQNEYALTEVKTVNAYIAGFAVFSKQLLRNLPFMQTTLTRMLLRDFYKKENSIFFTTISSAATGFNGGFTSPDDVKQVITLIANQLTANYTPSFVVVAHSLMSRLIQSTYTNGYYAGAGAVMYTPQGMTIWGVPIVSASWVPDQKVFIADADYLERVEVEGLNITFSFEDSVNFRQNKVTARIECFEAINPMRADSMIYGDLGAS